MALQPLFAVLGLVALLTPQEQPPVPGKTTVSAHLLTGHAKGQNLIWCSSFQLAWNALGQDVCGEPVRLQGSPVMERALNGSGIGKQDLDPESVFTKAARLSPGLVDEINASLKKQFGDLAPPPLQAPLTQGGVLAYAFLHKSLQFKRPFDRQQEPLPWRGTEGGKMTLQAFGIPRVGGQTPKELSSQVQILSDRRGAYVIELKTMSARDRLILAQTEPKSTLKETLDDVRDRVRAAAAPPISIQVTDQILIPCIQVAIDRVYDEIIGRTVLNKKAENQVVSEARQNLHFTLNEKGATAKSEAILVTKNGHAPRQIVFDQPFLLYLERVGAENPYLAIWFENPNLFLRSEPSEKK